MGVDVCALVTEWEPAVAAYQAAGGMGFYWDANMERNFRFDAGEQSNDLPELPFLTEDDLPGGRSAYLRAAQYYDFLRRHLPAPMRAAADATFGLLLPHHGFDWAPERRDDLATDAGLGRDGDVLYALRPQSVRAVLAGQPPWEALLAIAEQHDFEPGPESPPDDHGLVNASQFEMTAWRHLNAVADAAEDGLGVITVITY